ncbi:MAG: hypothetical protein OFPII_43220 [Osedax symbiont Rs1]|nr:MAG: hypothetical protein OFPII_43220 [Osedax symbiont Rs1]
MKKNYLSFGVVIFLFIGCTLYLKSQTLEYNYENIVFQKDQIRIKTKSVQTLSLEVEIARSSKELALGLMYRKKPLGNYKGMLFIFEKPLEITMWMKNTYIPLDIVFFDSTGQIIHIAKGAKPEDLAAISSHGLAQYVLEIDAGNSSKLNIKIGDYLKSGLLLK